MEKQTGGFAWLLVILAVLYILSLRDDLKTAEKQIAEIENQASYCAQKVDQFKEALEEANNAIEQAKSYEGESYREMEDALANLQTVDEP